MHFEKCSKINFLLECFLKKKQWLYIIIPKSTGRVVSPVKSPTELSSAELWNIQFEKGQKYIKESDAFDSFFSFAEGKVSSHKGF